MQKYFFKNLYDHRPLFQINIVTIAFPNILFFIWISYYKMQNDLDHRLLLNFSTIYIT